MLEAHGLSYAYGADGPQAPSAVRAASLAVAPGEVVALVGPNGAGKSTLGRLLSGSLASDAGTVLVDGARCDADGLCSLVGYVRQDPESQIVAPDILDEVAFGPCNLGLPASEVYERVRDALASVGLSGFESRAVSTLSGGELQRVALAGVLAMHPAYLVLDEITSQLDPAARQQVRRIVRERADAGAGVLMVSHDVEDVLVADRVAVMEDGAVVREVSPWQVVARPEGLGLVCASRLGRALSLCADLGYEAPPAVELDVAALVSFARGAGALGRLRELLCEGAGKPRADGYSLNAVTSPREHVRRGDDDSADERPPSVDDLLFSRVTVSYGSHQALGAVSFRAADGRVTLLAGRSGAGKSTAALVAAGLLEPDAGEVTVGGGAPRPGHVGLCLQRPENQLFCDSVCEDVSFGPRNLGCLPAEARERARRSLRRLGVEEELWERSPFALSGGQRRRVALAGVLALEPAAFVLDEPTVGLDSDARRFLHGIVRELAGRERPVVVVSHDLGEWLEVADDVVLLDGGRVCWRGSASSLLSDPRPLERAGLLVPAWIELLRASCAATTHDGLGGGERA